MQQQRIVQPLPLAFLLTIAPTFATIIASAHVRAHPSCYRLEPMTIFHLPNDITRGEAIRCGRISFLCGSSLVKQTAALKPSVLARPRPATLECGQPNYESVNV